jgi:hypothetical protein
MPGSRIAAIHKANRTCRRAVLITLLVRTTARPGSGILYVLFCWTFIPALVGLLEGIVLLSMSDERFVEKYCLG